MGGVQYQDRNTSLEANIASSEIRPLNISEVARVIEIERKLAEREVPNAPEPSMDYATLREAIKKGYESQGIPFDEKRLDKAVEKFQQEQAEREVPTRAVLSSMVGKAYSAIKNALFAPTYVCNSKEEGYGTMLAMMFGVFAGVASAGYLANPQEMNNYVGIPALFVTGTNVLSGLYELFRYERKNIAKK